MTLVLRSKVNLDRLYLLTIIVSLCLIYLANIMTNFNSYRKINLLIIFLYIALGIKFDLAVKYVNVNPESSFVQTNVLRRAYIPNATYQVPMSLAFWIQRRRFC